MITSRLKNIFALSIPLFILHGIEEVATGLSTIDFHVAFVFGWLSPSVSLETAFVIFQLIFWIVLVASYFLMTSGRWVLQISVALGLVYLYELHHLYKVIETGGYYPGTLSALLLYVAVFFYFKELWPVLKAKWISPGETV